MKILNFFARCYTSEALRANIGSKLAISLQRWPFDPKFQVEGVAPTKNSSQKTRLNYHSYGMKFFTDLLQFCHNARVWQTDRRTDFSSLDRVCIPCNAAKTKFDEVAAETKWCSFWPCSRGRQRSQVALRNFFAVQKFSPNISRGGLEPINAATALLTQIAQ